jgi:4-amino-4-deoxy-L-arabinose transferase-like glycosyltransferase
VTDTRRYLNHAFWGVLLVGIALRFFRLGENSFWIDEVGSLRFVGASFWEVPTAALANHAFEPPVYFWLLDIMVHLFGLSEVSARAVSAIAGALTIPVVWLLLKELTRREAVAAR